MKPIAVSAVMCMALSGCGGGSKSTDDCLGQLCADGGAEVGARAADAGRGDVSASGSKDADGDDVNASAGDASTSGDGDDVDASAGDASTSGDGDSGGDVAYAEAAEPDAGGINLGAFGDCFGQLDGGSDPTGDAISVRGQAGALGAVDYTVWGYSAGAAGYDGLQRFTNSAYGQRGAPSGVDDTDLWAWTNMPMAMVGTTYVDGPAQLDFQITYNQDNSQISCTGDSSGKFMFVRFSDPITQANPVDGAYEFHCLDAGIDVSGCFHYAN
ncbi:MAG TPA: hypothetical protein VH137_06340 [Gemmatimonadales bacterium]|nr:hypothetical protein [Gemmatimonadales bacterium]